MEINITSSGMFSHRQKRVQITSGVFLGFTFSGLEYMDFYSPEGFFVGSGTNLSLLMVPAGFKIDFSYNARRENYVTICQMDSLRWNPKSHLLELHLRDQVVEIPLVIKAPLGRVEMLRDLFRRTAELTRSAIYADHLAAEMLMQTVVAEFIEYSRSASAEVVPEHIARLKKLIDEDTAFRYDLSEIMSEFKYTPIYLRRLFKKYYSTNPAEYRARLRFNRIQQLLSESDLSIKEIADAVGMNHVTHLHTFVKQRCGMTPSELRRNLDM